MKTALRINSRVHIPENEIELAPMRAQGPGGQHINKVATALQLRFDIRASSLPEIYKDRLLALPDRRITKAGVLVIKAERYRSQDKNRRDALERLRQLVQGVTHTPRQRHQTRPTRASQRRRLEHKQRRGRLKQMRSKVGPND